MIGWGSWRTAEESDWPESMGEPAHSRSFIAVFTSAVSQLFLQSHHLQTSVDLQTVAGAELLSAVLQRKKNQRRWNSTSSSVPIHYFLP